MSSNEPSPPPEIELRATAADSSALRRVARVRTSPEAYAALLATLPVSHAALRARPVFRGERFQL
jgi:hypothetical protein